jgi:hypothetical protein
MNPANPPGSHPGFPYENLSASQAYIITYAIIVLFFIVSMFARGACYHWWTLGSGQRIHVLAVHK